jgi:hypothetical protein
MVLIRHMFLLASSFLDQAGHLVAGKTFVIMYRDKFSTVFAAVLLVLPFCEKCNAFVPYGFQVLLHAHAVIFTVSFIHAFNFPAGILVAGKTKHGCTIVLVVDPRAFGKEIGAGLVGTTTAATLALPKPMYKSTVAAANGAVHPTGRN